MSDVIAMSILCGTDFSVAAAETTTVAAALQRLIPEDASSRNIATEFEVVDKPKTGDMGRALHGRGQSMA